MAEDYLEQVRRMALGAGFTEGGVLKALADAANELKRSDYQFEVNKRFKEQELEDAYTAQKSAEERQRMSDLVTLLGQLFTPFGKEGSPGGIKSYYDKLGKPVTEMYDPYGAVPNIFSRMSGKEGDWLWKLTGLLGLPPKEGK